MIQSTAPLIIKIWTGYIRFKLRRVIKKFNRQMGATANTSYEREKAYYRLD